MITSAKNPKFANSEKTLIDLVATHSQYGEIPFTASANDSEESGRDLHARAIAGEFGPVSPYVAPVIRQEVVDAQTSAAAKQELQRLRLEGVDALIAWAASQAVGPDRAAMQGMIAAMNAEKAKIR